MMFSLTIGVTFLFILFLSSIVDVFGQEVTPFNVAAVGDISCNENGKQTILSIANSHPNLIILLGDLSYDDSLSCFFDQTQVLENNGPFQIMITIGNHDVNSGDGNEETKKQLMFSYNIPKEGYYSKTFDHNGSKILVVAMNFTGLEEKEESKNSKNVLENEQYNFIKNELENSNAKYKIVISHAPFVSIKCNSMLEFFRLSSCHSSLEDWDKTLFNKYHSLFKNTGVDIVLSGHNHNYQREEKDSINYIISGLGGRSQYKMMDESDTHFADVYGFLQLKLYDKYIEGKFISNGDGHMDKDKFKIGIS
jgi:predicted phosphodiesterase